MQKVRTLTKGAALAFAAFALSGCYYAPYPPPPPPPVAAAPAGYYAAPCCYSYPEYPPAYYGPGVGVGVVVGGGGRHWR